MSMFVYDGMSLLSAWHQLWIAGAGVLMSFVLHCFVVFMDELWFTNT
jgi:hypothetical protein